MIILTATWGLGYAALIVAAATLTYHTLSRQRNTAGRRVVRTLLALSAAFLWAALAIRVVRGHGWPFQSPADIATGIVLVMLPVHFAWSIWTRHQSAERIVTLIALALLSYSLSQQPPTLSTLPQPSLGVRLGTVLNLGGGAFLALATAASLTALINATRRLTGHSGPAHDGNDLASEAFVRAALFCLALSLAVDTWWLQKVGLGNTKDAQQAGIAVTWMVYFVAIRLRTQPGWKGWPWTAIVTVGFGCALPILLNVSWLEMTLPL